MLSPPKPIEGLNEVGPPPFLTKTYDMVDDTSCNHIVCWSKEGNSFLVRDPRTFSTDLLPRFFKHDKFSSFVRQLNTYGFRKVDPDKWEFANEGFLRGQKHLLRNIRRRKAPSQQQALGSYLELKTIGKDGELNRRRRDKQIQTMELVNLRLRQQNTRAQLQAMEMKLQGTERKQQQMVSFLARTIQNPNFIKQLGQLKGKRMELEDVINMKRQRPIDLGESSQSCHRLNPIKSEPFDFEDLCRYELSELETLALEMQGIGKARKEQDENIELFDSGDGDMDDEFWKQLLNEKINEELVFTGDEEGEEEEEEEDVDV